MSLQYLKKEVRDKVDFNISGIKISCKVILSLLMGMIKHSQSTQSNNFAISLQYLKKSSFFLNRVHFFRTDKHQSFYKLALSFLMEVSRNVQSTQSSAIVMQNIQNCTGVQSCSLLLVNS